MRKGALIHCKQCRAVASQQNASPIGDSKTKPKQSSDSFNFVSAQWIRIATNGRGLKSMAIYHFSAQVISRGKGQSAVASASYRSGEKLIDERTGEIKYYKRDVQPESMILAPEHSPEWVQDRQRLWNEIEQAETRKDAQLAREINIALPVELSNDQQRELIREYIQEQFVNKGMVADIAIHRDDPNNPHAHVMLTTREISEDGFGKKNREWNDRKLLEQWREQWAKYANRSLEREGFQERISHLSHEARGLEVLPTKHEGHVVREMERKGIQTEIGNYNREVKEYNQAVVDLQKYREEKKALEQQQARQEAERQKKERFNTPTERVHLQEASKYLKSDPTFENIQERQTQLDKWEKRLDNHAQYLRWKDQSIEKASEHYRWIDSFKQQIQQEQKRIENINWLNPMKLKDNRMIKDQSERKIEHLKGEMKYHDEKLNYYREKLGFSTETEFRKLEKAYQQERPELIQKNRDQRQVLNQERDAIKNAQKALENRFVREVASKYPERPEMAHMSFKTALQIHTLNQSENRIVSIEEIKQAIHKRDQKVQQLQSQVDHAHNENNRLYRAEGYLKGYLKANEIIEKYENNPFLKGKMMVSKEAKQEYQKALSDRQQYGERLKEFGVKDSPDFLKQRADNAQLLDKVPQIQEQAESLQKGTSILDGIMQGVEQATREMERQQKREHQKTKQKGKYKGMEREL